MSSPAASYFGSNYPCRDTSGVPRPGPLPRPVLAKSRVPCPHREDARDGAERWLPDLRPRRRRTVDRKSSFPRAPGSAERGPVMDARDRIRAAYNLPEPWPEYLASRAVPPDVAHERGYRVVLQGKPLDGTYASAHGFPPKSAAC